jgi:type IV pilus biogenesis protein CpaD/CtpE
MIRRIPALCGVTVMLGLLAGCVDRDPYRRTDVWYPSGANAGNLAAMVANPNDLIRGHGVQKSDGKEAATAIDHIWVDKPKPLPDPTGAQSGSGSGAGAGAGG